MLTDPEEIMDALAAAFGAEDVKWKPQVVSGNRALAVPFVDARAIMGRLDEVLGITNWATQYEVLPNNCVKCILSLRIGGEWIAKEDVGNPSEQPDEGDRTKAAFSDALKRSAVNWGIGRYLYRARHAWYDYDVQKKRFVNTPPLPPGPQPRHQRQPEARVRTPQEANGRSRQQAPAEQPAAQRSFYQKLKEYDAKLTAEGLCKAGDLVKHVAAALTHAGISNSDMSTWGATEIMLARGATEQFLALRREAQECPPASGKISLYETIQMTEEDMIQAGLCQAGELVDFLVRRLGRSIPGHVTQWSDDHREEVDHAIAQFQESMSIPDEGTI